MKTLVFDMDGTIADLYSVPDWLHKLRTSNATPYKDAKFMYNNEKLNSVLNELKKVGYRVIINSWTAKNGTPTYNKEVRRAKIEWLNKHGFPYDEIHITKYGRTKADAVRHHGKGNQILIDDNEKVRKGWKLGGTINAQYNIIPELEKLLVA